MPVANSIRIVGPAFAAVPSGSERGNRGGLPASGSPTRTRQRSLAVSVAVGVALAGAVRAQSPAFDLGPAVATDPAALHVVPGFKVDLLYTVPKSEQGSWVSLAVDPKGRLIAGDQYGGLFRIALPPPGTTTGAKVEPLALPSEVVGAQGLLCAFDSLYVMVNDPKAKTGIWRLRDLDGDDRFEDVQFIRAIKGAGEHGVHALALSPDGRSLAFLCGNGSQLPAAMEKSRPVAWGEDHLLPRLWDPRGPFNNKPAPAGYIARMDPAGKTVELAALGFRNPYDIAFDANGELFTFDADSEGDQGTPWYLPTRIVHVTDGGDFGWRGGAGRWPAYYADSLPATLDVGPASPTGVTFGTGARFPAKYQRAFFAADWTYGTLHAIHLTPEGASFRATKEEFVAGKPLPLTDLVVNPHDGAMYFAVGGRRTQAALYRVTYTGSEPTAPAAALPPTPEAKLRRSLETLSSSPAERDPGASSAALDTAWPHLGNADRFVRYAARVAIERQPAASWAERALAEKNPQASIEALIALARVGEKSQQPRLIAALGRRPFAEQPPGLQLPLLRAWQLAFIRMGKPAPERCAQLAAQFEPSFPHPNAAVNRELMALLVFLDSAAVVAKTVPLLKIAEPVGSAAEEQSPADRALLARNETYGRVVQAAENRDARSDRQQIAYAYILRNATAGWTPALRADFFSWFARTRDWKGGNSFRAFLEKIRTDALAQIPVPTAERASLEASSRVSPTAPAAPAAAISPKGPGRAYTVVDAVAVITPAALRGRDFAHGQGLFAATACLACHRFNGEGGGLGPDISGAGNRYSIRDLLENIIEPSRVISDQYASEQVELRDGTTLVGRVVGEEHDELVIAPNPFMPDEKARVKLSAVKSRQPYKVSMMPPGLVDALNEDELKDLVAYILSGGNGEDKKYYSTTAGAPAPGL